MTGAADEIGVFQLCRHESVQGSLPWVAHKARVADRFVWSGCHAAVGCVMLVGSGRAQSPD